MFRGKVIEIDRPRGFGFIKTDSGEKIFFHQRWLRKIRFRELQIGDEVIFTINQGPRGPRAHNLRLAADAEEIVQVSRGDELFKEQFD
ncbi:Cold shock protein CspB (modular protein) [Candidatus Zixiibacteriota bacterium]|nr:Cold shock protein CspB (modular protein) [candidate division Zixibacteria bacterium]